MATKQCEHCGAEHPRDARFCIECGSRLDAATGPTTKLDTVDCESCGTPNPKGARFCVTCGRTMGDHSAPQPRVAPPQSVPRVAPAQPAQPAQPTQPANSGWPQNMSWVLVPVVLFVGVAMMSRFRMNFHNLWPMLMWLFFLGIGATAFIRGRLDGAAQGLLWFGAFALLFTTGMFWPLIVLGIALNSGKWGGHGRHWHGGYGRHWQGGRRHHHGRRHW